MTGTIPLLGLLLLAGTPPGRHVAIVMDTSTSMRSTDKPRYAIQVTKILSDLAEDGDDFSVTHLAVYSGFSAMTFRENCSAPSDQSLQLRLGKQPRTTFKDKIDTNSDFNTDVNAFAAAVHTARDSLGQAGKRMLLFIADSGGFDQCEAGLTGELRALRNAGVYVAAINLGASTGTFGNNPGIETATPARNSEELVKAVASVYQQFLGAKKVQTGPARGDIEVTIDPFVKNAYVVVASDAEMPPVLQDAANPGADGADLNYRGGGATRGLDGNTRGYRIVHLVNPKPGKWVFHAGNVQGGFMLLQDYAVGVRLLSGKVPNGAAAQWEVFDERNGQRIADPAVLSGLTVEVTGPDGRRVSLRDDGKGDDKVAGDGMMTHTGGFTALGRHTMSGKISSAILDRTFSVDFDIVESELQLRLVSPASIEILKPARIEVRADAIGPPPPSSKYPERLTAKLPDGSNLDFVNNGTGTYGANWTPGEVGTISLHITADGGIKTESLDTQLEVLGRLEFPSPPAIRIGPVHGGGHADAVLDLTSAKVYGSVTVSMGTSLDKSGATFEIETEQGWQEIEGATLRVGESGQRRWPVRVRAGECPAACSASEQQHLLLNVKRTNSDSGNVTRIPLFVEIIPDSLIYCWRKRIVASAITAIAGFLVYGFVWPYRFHPRVGLRISPEEDLSEGYFYVLRQQPGSRPGFYRHARVYIADTHRISGKRRGAFVCIRADRNNLKIRAVNGLAVYKQSLDGEWRLLPDGENFASNGTIYRNEESTLFFGVRAG